VNRGNARSHLKKYEDALADELMALRLDPDNIYGQASIGTVYYRMGNLKKSVVEYTKAIKINPSFPDSYYNRFMANYRLGKEEELTADAERYLSLKEWRGHLSIYLSLVRIIRDRKQSGEDAARARLAEALEKCESKLWPYPILRYLRGDFSAENLFQQDNDHDHLTESRAYVGLYLSAAGQSDAALPHLRWVRESGNKELVEYALALVELTRLERR
jgi:tetratricopeptide (TPR) repeat protein